MMKIGFHVSISQGFDATLEKAQKLQCEAVQIFVKNPRSWVQRTLSDKDTAAFSRLSAVLPVYAHLSYLPNLAKIDGDEHNLKGLLHEASLCARLGIKYLVAHPGSHSDKLRGAQITAQAVNAVHDNYDVAVLIENTAGQGRALGTNIEELARIYEGVENKGKVLFCIDTAHLFQSGYKIIERSGWNDFVREFDRMLGIEKIGFFHLNDSKTPAGTHADRHWHIGEGEIGLKFFKRLLKDKRFAHLAGVMETPKMGNMDEVNMKVMRSLL
ncbi:MAG: putative endonuclease, partial [Deltaproteobacteria bacterium]|nr:putative endonuclease [Deltaproteobacteria bacterium]